MSNVKAGEKPARRKPRFPALRSSEQGESAPKVRLRSVADGKLVNIPAPISSAKGDGVLKVIRVLDIPVYERRRLTGKSVNGSPRRRIEVERSTEVTEWASRKSL